MAVQGVHKQVIVLLLGFLQYVQFLVGRICLMCVSLQLQQQRLPLKLKKRQVEPLVQKLEAKAVPQRGFRITDLRAAWRPGCQVSRNNSIAIWNIQCSFQHLHECAYENVHISSFSISMLTSFITLQDDILNNVNKTRPVGSMLKGKQILCKKNPALGPL